MPRSLLVVLLTLAFSIGVDQRLLRAQDDSPSDSSAASTDDAAPGDAASDQSDDAPSVAAPRVIIKEVTFYKRLPNFYNQVVDEEQKETIYQLQRRYFGQIAQLKAQIEALEEERDRQIEDVLTSEQKDEVARLRAEAEAARKARAAAKKAALEAAEGALEGEAESSERPRRALPLLPSGD